MVANNRLFLRCQIDGDTTDAFCLGKWFPSAGWYQTADRSGPLSDWMQQHTLCALDARFDASQDGRCFELVYEMDEGITMCALYPTLARRPPDAG